MGNGKAFLGAAVIAAAMAGPAQAKMAEVPSYNWTGFYFGGGVGFRWLDGDVDVDGEKSLKKKVDCVPWTGYYAPIRYGHCYETDGFVPVYGSPHSFSGTSDLDGDPSLFGTVIGGFDWQSKRNPRFVFGAFVDADFGDADADFDLTILKSGYNVGSAHGKLSLDYLFTVGGRFGVLSHDYRTLAYGLVGWSHAEFNDTSYAVHIDSWGGFPGVSAYGKLPDDADGLTVGGGVESKLTDRLSLRLEARATFLDSGSSDFSGWNTGDPYYGTKFKKYVGDGGNCYYGNKLCEQEKITKKTDVDGSINIDPDLYSFRAVLTYKFGRNYAPAPLK